jgi:hypothetical protein
MESSVGLDPKAMPKIEVRNHPRHVPSILQTDCLSFQTIVRLTNTGRAADTTFMIEHMQGVVLTMLGDS